MISFLIPCYNEAQRLGASLDMIETYFGTHAFGEDIQIVFIDDGSTDETYALLQTFQQRSRLEVKVLQYTPNTGKGYALRYGWTHIDADRYFVMDADLATPLSEIDPFLQKRSIAPIIIGSRSLEKKPQRSWMRRQIGCLAERCIHQFLPLSIRDTQCGFKLFHHSCSSVRRDAQINRRGSDFEILYLLEQQGTKILEIPVDRTDKPGTKRVGMDYIDTLRELFLVKYTYEQSRTRSFYHACYGICGFLLNAKKILT